MVRKSFKTPKGTELPLMNLKGKEYLMVAHRLVWFREEHESWTIETQLITATENLTLAKATIKDESGRVIATAHKMETKQGFADHTEKAETGAIGRALAICSYGTQFTADELDEGTRLADSPVESPKVIKQPPLTIPKITNGSGVTKAPTVKTDLWEG